MFGPESGFLKEVARHFEAAEREAMHVKRAALDHWTQKFHPGRPGQFHMKGRSSMLHRSRSPSTCAASMSEIRASSADLPSPSALLGQNGRHRPLYRKADPHHFGGGAQGGLGNDGAAIAAPFHQPLLGKQQKRLAHGALAAPELVRQSLFD